MVVRSAECIDTITNIKWAYNNLFIRFSWSNIINDVEMRSGVRYGTHFLPEKAISAEMKFIQARVKIICVILNLEKEITPKNYA